MTVNHTDLAARFKALSDPKRIAILTELKSGERCVCHLEAVLPLTQSGLSYHLKVLLGAGLIEARAEGKWTYYRLNADGFAALGLALAALGPGAESGSRTDCSTQEKEREKCENF